MNWELIFVIGFLSLANVAQFIFWSKQNQKLVDKLMSGSFASYQAAQTIGTEKKPFEPEHRDLSGLDDLITV